MLRGLLDNVWDYQSFGMLSAAVVEIFDTTATLEDLMSYHFELQQSRLDVGRRG